jgi:hypothetical protein
MSLHYTDSWLLPLNIKSKKSSLSFSTCRWQIRPNKKDVIVVLEETPILKNMKRITILENATAISRACETKVVFDSSYQNYLGWNGTG